MNDFIDVHMHTIASGHAYSTVREMFTAARARGMRLAGIADHAPYMPGAPHKMYFCNFKVVHQASYGLEAVMGAELNILDYSGSTDLSEKILCKLDYAIASLHELCISPGTKAQNTAALIGAMRNPRVTIIGHPDNGRYPVDFDVLAQTAKETHTLLELNNSSYANNAGRPGSRENAREMLQYCKKYSVPVLMSSDAHIDSDAGSHEQALAVLQETDFPEALVINGSLEQFRDYLYKA